MFQLHCEDIISSLQRKAAVLKDKVLKKMSLDHQERNKSLCEEYEKISRTALSSPGNTEELVELKKKVQHIRTVIVAEKEAELSKVRIPQPVGQIIFRTSKLTYRRPSASSFSRITFNSPLTR